MRKIILLVVLLLIGTLTFAQEASIEFKTKDNDHKNFKEVIETNVKSTFEDSVLEESKTRTEILITEDIIKGGDPFKSKQNAKITLYTVNGEDHLSDWGEGVDTTSIYEMNKRGKALSLTNEKGEKNEEFKVNDEEYAFPDKNVKVGDTWKCKKNINGGLYSVVCTLEKLYSKDGVDIAKIKLDINDTVITNFEDGSKNETNAKGTGVYYFAVNLGDDLYISYDIEFNTKLDSTVEGNNLLIYINNKYKYKYWRCE